MILLKSFPSLKIYESIYCHSFLNTKICILTKVKFFRSISYLAGSLVIDSLISPISYPEPAILLSRNERLWDNRSPEARNPGFLNCACVRILLTL